MMLLDAERNTELWLTEEVCSKTPSLGAHGFWSFDGVFLGVNCEDEQSTELPVVRVLNTQSGEWSYIADPISNNTEYWLYGWSPTANQLALGSHTYNDEGETSNLILFDATEHVSVTVTADDVIMGILWSPDGSQLLLVTYDYSDTDTPQTLYIISNDGTVAKTISLPTSYGSITFSRWDSNGHILHYVTTESKSGTFDIDTEQFTIGSDTRLPGTYYIWSPMKEWYIAGTGYAQNESTPSVEELSWSLYSEDGTLVRDLSTDPARQDFTFDWFPDGQRFVMVSIQDGAWVITENYADSDVPPREITRVSIPEGHGSAPTVKISPDSSLIAFSTRGSSITVVFDLQGKEFLQQPGYVQGWRPE